MLRSIDCVCLALLILGSVMVGGGTHSAAWAAHPGGQENVVMSEALSDVPGSKLTAVLVTYAPGGKSPKHHHAGSVFAYVVSGSIRSQNSATGPEKVYRAGESFFEPSGSVHLVSENASATQPASLLAVFVAPSDATLTVQEQP
jgi:quercetin dioxygenase-like cupin family protein